MKKDKPSFQFYPSDWLGDSALRACSVAARGVWIDLLCLMHEGNPYGHLTLPNGNEIDLRSVAHRLHIDVRSLRHHLSDLERHGVVSRSDIGTYLSKRMIEDERVRNIHRLSGKLGGNPTLLDKEKQTPSSSSSASLIKATDGGVNRNGNGQHVILPTKVAVDCEYCGLIPDHDHHKKCHDCFLPFKEGVPNVSHTCKNEF